MLRRVLLTLEKRRALFAWLATGLFVVLLLWAATGSSSYKQCQSDKEANYSSYDDPSLLDQAVTFFACEGVSIADNGEFITALATIALVFSTVLLWGATRQSVDVARRALTELERPYLFIESIILRIELLPVPVLKVVLHNYGRTPTNIARFGVHFRVLDHVPTQADETVEVAGGGTVPERQGSEYEIVVGQNSSWTSPEIQCWNFPDADMILAIEAGQMHLYFWGSVTYRDIFRQVHPTYFCRRFNMEHRSWEVVGGWDKNYGE